MITVYNLTKKFTSSHGTLIAVDSVSFEIQAGETVAVVGESGCGKSTLGKLLLRLLEPTSGTVQFHGINLFSLPPLDLKKWRQEAQMIFQDPYAALDPRMSAEEIVAEPLLIHGIQVFPHRIIELFEQVGLNPNHRKKYPHEFSGGQRQRLGIARALILKPSFIVCDEPISSLDLSTQAQILNLLIELRDKVGLTYFFISHDLRMVKYIADRVLVMHAGKIVEQGKTKEIFSHPMHPYTRSLIAAIPKPFNSIYLKT